MDNAVGSRKDFPGTSIECKEPAPVAQLDGKDRLLRINAEVDAPELLAALYCVELSVDPVDIMQTPSACRGGGG